MVQNHTLFKKRINDDLDNIDYVQDPSPKTEDGKVLVSPSGFPLFREITDASFIQQAFGVNNYKKLNTTDIYGMYTSFLVRPGIRKLQTTHLEITVKQRGNKLQIPSVAFGILGLRPVDYDETSGGFTPLVDYFTLDRNTNMMCLNSSEEFKDDRVGGITNILNLAGVCPLAIENVDLSTYKHFPLHDAILYTNWKHVGTITANNDVYTTHVISSPIYSHFADVAHLPIGNAFEAKFMLYVLYPEYLDSGVNTSDPVLKLLPSDEIVSLTGFNDIT